MWINISLSKKYRSKRLISKANYKNTRLLGALLMEQNEKWSSGRKYLNIEEYLSWRESNSPTTKVTH